MIDGDNPRVHMFAAVLLAAAFGSAALSLQAGHTVEMPGEDFRPFALTISVGDSVTWINTGAGGHNVRSYDGLFASDTLANGRTYTFTFTAPGTYGYRCSIHPSTMTGEVVVRGVSGATPTALPPEPILTQAVAHPTPTTPPLPTATPVTMVVTPVPPTSTPTQAPAPTTPPSPTSTPTPGPAATLTSSASPEATMSVQRVTTPGDPGGSAGPGSALAWLVAAAGVVGAGLAVFAFRWRRSQERAPAS